MNQPQLFEDDSIREVPGPSICRDRTYNGKSIAGMADFPGTGPAGETCGSCANRIQYKLAKTYQKCRLGKQTGGKATDIKVYFPACSQFAPLEGKPDAVQGEYKRSEEEWINHGGLR